MYWLVNLAFRNWAISPTQAHSFECLVPSWWNCLKRIRRLSVVGWGVSLGVSLALRFQNWSCSDQCFFSLSLSPFLHFLPSPFCVVIVDKDVRSFSPPSWTLNPWNPKMIKHFLLSNALIMMFYHSDRKVTEYWLFFCPVWCLYVWDVCGCGPAHVEVIGQL